VPRPLTDLAGLNVRAEELLAVVLDTAAQPILVMDCDDVIRLANPAALAALGYDDATELPGRRSHETIHYRRPDGTACPGQECPLLFPRVTGERAASDLDWFVRRDGSTFPVSYISVPLEMPECRGAVVAFREVEDRLGEVRHLADEQAALRRVATLVARESSPAQVFAAVAEELGRLLHLDDTRMVRYEDDGTATVVASCGQLAGALPVGTRVRMEGETTSTLVRQTGRPARIDRFTNASGPFAASLRDLGVRAAVGAPIVIDGRLWGAVSAASLHPDPIPPETEARMREFTELVATAISNVQARSDLAASRARLVAAADDERRRVVRDLHDGVQQRLVVTILTLKQAHEVLQSNQEPASELVANALDHAERASVELRELARGILPAVLTRGGLRAGVESLASRTPVPVEIDVSVGRLPAAIEATAYFVVAEALCNVAKHARARSTVVGAHIEDGTLCVSVRDDGVGGAQPEGSGLLGLADRLAVLDGRLRVESLAEGGTLVAADIPLRH
jgi:PAS domain S-box-containing protein